MRRREILFGSFGRLCGAPLLSRDWWFCRAEGVTLQGTIPTWCDLHTYKTQLEVRVERSAPELIDADWARKNLPIGLGLPPNFNSYLAPIHLDVVAMRVDADVETAYPFLLRERESRILCGFSSDGPPSDIRDCIVVELGCRLLWTAKGGFR
jgi:hypothetical protein